MTRRTAAWLIAAAFLAGLALGGNGALEDAAEWAARHLHQPKTNYQQEGGQDGHE